MFCKGLSSFPLSWRKIEGISLVEDISYFINRLCSFWFLHHVKKVVQIRNNASLKDCVLKCLGKYRSLILSVAFMELVSGFVSILEALVYQDHYLTAEFRVLLLLRLYLPTSGGRKPIIMWIKTHLVVEQRVLESFATTQKLSLLEKMVE